jgi:hypothetical protein
VPSANRFTIERNFTISSGEKPQTSTMSSPSGPGVAQRIGVDAQQVMIVASREHSGA